MAIDLVSMSEEEYIDFYRFSVREYAKGHIKAGNWSEKEANENAAKQFDQLLPQGLYTKDHKLFTIQQGQNSIGHLWIYVELNKKQAFIYDVYLKEEARGKGYGKETMQALDEYAISNAIEKISLHVFAYNETAIQLYKSMGYEITDYYMSKVL